MAATFKIDNVNGGFNMPNADTQLGFVYANTKEFAQALNAISAKLQKMEIDSPREANFGLPQTIHTDHIAHVLRKAIVDNLAIVRNEIIKEARNGISSNDRGAASTAVFRRNYADVYGGNVNISGNRRRMSSRRREWSKGKILDRDVSPTTKRINRYYGLDRAFILRILESGRDNFMATSFKGLKGPGSKATWGRRGAMTARGFFHEMAPQMEEAAKRVGENVLNYVNALIK